MMVEIIAPRVKWSPHGVESRQALDVVMAAKVMALGVILIVKVKVKVNRATETFAHGQILWTAIEAMAQEVLIRAKGHIT